MMSSYVIRKELGCLLWYSANIVSHLIILFKVSVWSLSGHHPLLITSSFFLVLKIKATFGKIRARKSRYSKRLSSILM